MKSTLNYLGLLRGIFEHAVRRGWAPANPCKRVGKPKAADADADVRFLDQAELDALLVAVRRTTSVAWSARYISLRR